MTRHPENGLKVTLDNPMPGHYPDVGRDFQGTNTYGSGRGGRHYGTTLSCSCGWTPRMKTLFAGTDREKLVGDSKLSNEAPSKGGTSEANRAYQAHIATILEQAS